MNPVRILILGTGGMANSHAEAYAALPGAEIVAGVDTNAENLNAFAQRHNVGSTFETLQDALDWGKFDAVSNVTPDAVHHATTLPCLAAGKHVLCEKPLAANYQDAVEMAERAAQAGVVNMMNLTYRSGAMQQAADLVASGAIGEVRHFQASYLQSWLTQPAWGHWDREDQWLWRLSTAHGSKGCLGDVGVHVLDFATHIAGADVAELSCRLTTFDKAPGNRIGPYVLDANDSFAMHATLKNGATGVIHGTRFASGHLNDISMQIFGTKGGIEVADRHHVTTLRASIGEDMQASIWRDIETVEAPANYARFVEAIQAGLPAQPDFARGALLQKALDLAVNSDSEASRSNQT